MDNGSANLIELESVQGANLGRLHTDYPVDRTTERFKRRLQGSLFRLEGATDELSVALAKFDGKREENELRKARLARTNVEGFLKSVKELGSDAFPDLAGERDQLIRAAEWELLQVGTRLNMAAVSPAVAPTRSPAAPVPANLAGNNYWEVALSTRASSHGIENLETDFDLSSTHLSNDSNAGPSSPLFTQVDTEVEYNDMTRQVHDSDPPPESTTRPTSGHNLSITSSRRDAMQAQNDATRTAQNAQLLVDEALCFRHCVKPSLE
jgi:hypothetical protein